MTEVLHTPRTPDRTPSYYHSTQQSGGLRRSMPSSTALHNDNEHTPSASSSSSSLSSSPRTDATTLKHASSAQASATQPTADYFASIASTAAAALDVSIPPIGESQNTDQSSTPTQHMLNINTNIHNLNDASHLSVAMVSEPAATTPLSSPAYHYSSAVEDDSPSPTETTLSTSSLATPTVYDDSMIKEPPSQQVDFLTHEWREEDIWSSWRHIIANRKQFGEKSRLENASWRQWAKYRGNFRTVTPESLNWLKESDITWLYGPLKAASSYPISKNVSEPSSTRLSKNNSFVNKKPILKKRCLSEVMLAKSLSTSSLVREAATSALFSSRRPRRSDASSEFSESKLPSEAPSRAGETLGSYTSRSSSFCETPSCEKKHIRFDDVVEQCIAVDHPITLGLDDDSSDDEEAVHRDNSSTSSDDDGGLMMARKRRAPTLARPKLAGSRSNSHNGREIIKTLPNTTLKYRTDSPDITEQAQHHTFGSRVASNAPWNSSRISPSPSQETLRPTNPSANFLLPRDDEDSDDDKDGLTIDSDASWSFGSSNPRSSLGASSTRGRGSRGSSAARSHTPGPGGYSDDDFRMEGMRRTGSGMFMPEEEEEREYATGILGRIGEGINTARDIAHVIWTVGWRT